MRFQREVEKTLEHSDPPSTRTGSDESRTKTTSRAAGAAGEEQLERARVRTLGLQWNCRSPILEPCETAKLAAGHSSRIAKLS